MGIFMIHDPIIKKLIIHHHMMQRAGNFNTTVVGIILSLLGAILMNHLVEKPINDYFFNVIKEKTKEKEEGF